MERVRSCRYRGARGAGLICTVVAQVWGVDMVEKGAAGGRRGYERRLVVKAKRLTEILQEVVDEGVERPVCF